MAAKCKHCKGKRLVNDNKQINIAGKVFTYLKNNKKKILNENSKKRQLLTINNIIKLGVSKIDYLECVNLKTLKKSKAEKNKINIFIAYYFNNIRLIDNL